MYGMLFGQNPDSAQILSTIGLTPDDFYRFRDAYVDENGSIAVYTRGGGNNRECHGFEPCDRDQHGPECVETIQSRLHGHPAFISDDDDDYDCTYCTLRFRPANEIAIREYQNGVRGEALWPAFFEQLHSSAKASQ